MSKQDENNIVYIRVCKRENFVQFQKPISPKKFTPIRKIENALFIIGGKK